MGIHPVMDRYPPIGAEARGRLRVWKKQTAAVDARITNAALRLHKTGKVSAFVFKSGLGRRRAAEKILASLKGARLDAIRLDGSEPLMVFSRLRLSTRLFSKPIDPGEEQDVLVVDYLLIGSGPDDTCGISSGLWTLQCPTHALLRSIERNDRRADLTETVFDAHRNLLRVPRSAITNDEEFLLPAGAGCFIARMVLGILADDSIHQHAYARTWLHNDQLFDEQQPVPLHGPGPLGAGVLLPTPLRAIEPKPPYRITPLKPYMPEFVFGDAARAAAD